MSTCTCRLIKLTVIVKLGEETSPLFWGSEVTTHIGIELSEETSSIIYSASYLPDPVSHKFCLADQIVP